MRLRSLRGEPMIDLRLWGAVVRLFHRSHRPDNRPYAKRYLNMWLFGAGPIGIMVWPPHLQERGRP